MTVSIRGFSELLAGETSSNTNQAQRAEVFEYAIKVLLLNASALGGIIIFAWLLGSLQITLLVWAAAFSLRIFAGGRHSSGPVVCWLLTVSLFTGLGFLVHQLAPLAEDYVLLVTALGLVFSLYAVITGAPVTIASKKFSPSKRRALKMAAVAVLVFWSAVALAPLQGTDTNPAVSLGITAGMVLQSLFILPVKKRG